MKKVRLGFIGCGEHSTRDLFPIIPKISNLELVAVCDRNKEKAMRNAKLFGASKYYTNYEELLEKEDVEATMIVGPPKMHTEIGMACLDHGLHIFVEKPSASTVECAKKLAEKADEVGKFGQVGHFMRHSDAHQLAKKIINSEEFGVPILFNCKYFSNGPWEPRNKWGISDLDWTYMLVQGIHLIDISRFFMGEIISLNAKRHVSGSGRISFSVATRFDSDALGLLSFTSSSPNWQSRVEIIGDRGSYLNVENAMTLSYEQAKSWSKKYNFNEPILSQNWEGGTSYKSRPSFGYYGEIEHFVNSILNNKPPTPNLWDEYKALLIASAIIEDTNTGKSFKFQTGFLAE